MSPFGRTVGLERFLLHFGLYCFFQDITFFLVYKYLSLTMCSQGKFCKLKHFVKAIAYNSPTQINFPFFHYMLRTVFWLWLAWNSVLHGHFSGLVSNQYFPLITTTSLSGMIIQGIIDWKSAPIRFSTTLVTPHFHQRPSSLTLFPSDMRGQRRWRLKL
jgi:hypothetical protein